MADCGCEIEIKNQEQQKALRWLLLINAVMFVVEFSAGIIAGSAALVADSLDMFADAAVYGVGLYAVGRTVVAKARAALLSGGLEVMLALFALCEVFRRAISTSEPLPGYMVLVGLVALMANVSCLLILVRHREGEVHMRASWIFSTNDVIANMGVIAGGAMVYFLGSRWPDLVIGLVVALIVLRGGIQILKEAFEAKANCDLPVLANDEG